MTRSARVIAISHIATKRYITTGHYTWSGFQFWYLLRLLPFHQGPLLLFSAFLGLEWLGFAKRFPNDRVNYVSFKYHKFLWTRICDFGKEPVIFNCSVICKETWQKQNGFHVGKAKMAKFAEMLVFADLRLQERLDTFPRASAVAFKPSTGCIQQLQPTCSFAGGFRPTFFNACRNSLLPSASSFSSVMVTSGSGCHFSLSMEIIK